MDAFDLIEWQHEARRLECPKKLFLMWDDVCQKYERRLISRYEVEEMKAVIWPQLNLLSALRENVNATFERAA